MKDAEEVTLLVKQEAKAPARLAIVRALFRNELTKQMEEVAKKHAAYLGSSVEYVFKVRGSMEIPLVAKTVLERDDVDGVVALGAVIQGETLHDRVVAENTAYELLRLSIETSKPVGIGIIGPGVTLDGAKKRVEEYAKGAVEAAVLSNTVLNGMKKHGTNT